MNEEPETKELLFAETKGYLRFGEFCDACRKYRSIGICHGVPGAGKTRSAREYASWDLLSPFFPEELFTLVGRRYLDDQFPHKSFATAGSPAFTDVLPCRTVYYTAPVAATPARIEREVMALSATLSYVVEAAEQANRGKDDFLLAYRLPKRTELVIVDEAQRLKEEEPWVAWLGTHASFAFQDQFHSAAHYRDDPLAAHSKEERKCP
jgi:hypothetical protein